MISLKKSSKVLKLYIEITKRWIHVVHFQTHLKGRQLLRLPIRFTAH